MLLMESRKYKLPNHLKTSVFLSINLYLKFIFTKSETIYQEQIKQGLNYHLMIKLQKRECKEQAMCELTSRIIGVTKHQQTRINTGGSRPTINFTSLQNLPAPVIIKHRSVLIPKCIMVYSVIILTTTALFIRATCLFVII